MDNTAEQASRDLMVEVAYQIGMGADPETLKRTLVQKGFSESVANSVIDMAKKVAKQADDELLRRPEVDAQVQAALRKQGFRFKAGGVGGAVIVIALAYILFGFSWPTYLIAAVSVLIGGALFYLGAGLSRAQAKTHE